MARSKVTDVPMALAVKIELFKRGCFDFITVKDGLKHEKQGLLETSHRIPNLDYDILMQLTLQLTKSMEECEKLYRLISVLRISPVIRIKISITGTTQAEIRFIVCSMLRLPHMSYSMI